MPIHNAKTFENSPELLSGNVQIIACAGSGKTEFVSERIAYQIHKGLAKPSEIVALTFNDAAAEELKFRVRDKIKLLIGKQPDIGDMYIGTIHAFAFRILQEFVPQYRAFDMLDENSRKAFTASIRWKDGINLSVLYNGLKKRGFAYNGFFARNKPGFWANWTLETFLKDIDLYREESLSEEYTDSQSFVSALHAYQAKLNERRFLDFSGILRLAVDQLQTNEYALDELRDRFKFFTIDEYQDINPIQEQLIRLVSGQQNVCVVGDDDQSIYQWRGADIANILGFEKNYDDVTTHYLGMNRRSHDNIVKCASAFISLNVNRFNKAIKPNNTPSESGDLYKVCFPHQEEEVTWIIEKIQYLYGKEYLDKGEPRKLMLSDMVLLFRRRADAMVYKNALEDAGIYVVYSGMGGLMDALEIRSLLRLFKYIGESAKEEEPNESLNDILDALEEIFPGHRKTRKTTISQIINWTKKQKRLSLQGFYYKVLNCFGLDDAIYHEDSDKEVLLYNLGKFSNAIADYEGSRTYLSKNDIDRFVEYINVFVSSAYDEGATNKQEGIIDAVKIMTLHGTKGLGFPVVFMPALKKPRSMSYEKITFLDKTKIDFSRYDGSTEDERRLFYVAITRAKKFLFLSTYHIKIAGKKRMAIHDFWDQISDQYFLTEPLPDPTQMMTCDIERMDSDVRFPTNYSELSYYLSCSYDYRMRFIYGFNPELVQALGYGKQVHNLINLLHKEYERSHNIPNEAILDKLIEAHFYMRYAATKQQERLKASCKQSLMHYLEMFKDDFSLAVKTEQEFEFDFEEKALINGSIDLVSRKPQNQNILEIIDFKTGKSESQFEEKYAHQVVLYVIAANEVLDKEIDKAHLHYLDTEGADRKEVNISPTRQNETRIKLREAVDGIMTNDYQRMPEHGTCSRCDWQTICPKKK